MTIEQRPERPPAPLPTPGPTTASLILGIMSIVFCWWGIFTLAMAVMAVLFGSKGKRLAEAGWGAGRGAGGDGLRDHRLVFLRDLRDSDAGHRPAHLSRPRYVCATLSA